MKRNAELNRLSLESMLVGNVYFIVNFYDEDLLIPEIKTYFYLGQGLFGEEDKSLCFQSAEGYYECGRWMVGKDAIKYGVLSMESEFLEHVFDYSGLQYQVEMMKRGGARYYD